MDVSFAPSAVVSPLSFRGQASFSFPFFLTELLRETVGGGGGGLGRMEMEARDVRSGFFFRELTGGGSGEGRMKLSSFSRPWREKEILLKR